MQKPQTPALALHSGSWTSSTAPTATDPAAESQPAGSVWQRLKRSRVARLIQLALLLRFLFSRQQHLILTGFHRICGDRFRLPLGRLRLVVLSDPQAIEEVLEQAPDKLSAGSLRKRLTNVLPEHCVFYAEGQRHEMMRRFVGKAFGQATQRLNTEEYFGSLVRELKSIPVERRTEAIRQHLVGLAGQVLFGSKDQSTDELAIRIWQSFDRMHSAGMLFPVLRIIPRVGKSFRQYHEAQTELLNLIDQKLHSGEVGSGMLYILRQASADELSDQEIRDNAAFIYLVVLRTLMPLFCNVAHALAVETHLQDELRAASHDRDSLFRAVVKETLRLIPFVPIFGRRAKQDLEVDGFRIAKGEFVIVSPVLTHFRPAAFPEPERFDPARFAGRDQYRYQFLPYGGGKHHCIGAGWSVQMTGQLVRLLLPEYRLVASQPHAKRASLTLRAIFLSRQHDGFLIENRATAN